MNLSDRRVLAGLPTESMHAEDELYSEYVATGDVTIGIPGSFPGADEPVVIAPRELVW